MAAERGRWGTRRRTNPVLRQLLTLALVMTLVGPAFATAAGTPTIPGQANLTHRAASATTYSVNLTENYLPAGTEWYLIVGARAWNSTTSYLSIEESNGSYPYFANATLVANGTEHTAVSNGSFRVDGHGISVVLAWRWGTNASAGSPGSSAASAGASNGIGTVELLAVVGVLAILGIAGAAAEVNRRGRRPPPPPAVPSVGVEAPRTEGRATTGPSPPDEDPLRHML
ncbi:MAG: hypothetical protein L3K08_06085 [Thermoplasmata archaeon]|nr:hypothetical protein [Thermoplasmata archaeon]